MTRATARALGVLWMAVLAAPLVVTLVRGHAITPPPPAAPSRLRDVERWPTRYRRWFQDHYLPRRWMIGTHAAVAYGVLGVSPSTVAVPGRDGWWYYLGDGGYDDLVSVSPLDAAATATWARTLDANRVWLGQRGARYLFVLAPDKPHVYPQYLPPGVRSGGLSRLEGLQQHLASRTDVPIADVRSALVAVAARDRVYHRTDTHWNALGALVAAGAVAESIREWWPDVVAPTVADYDRREARGPAGDILRMLTLESVSGEDAVELLPRGAPEWRVVHPADGALDAPVVVTERPGATGPRVMVVGDSFMVGLVPFLAQLGPRVVFVQATAPPVDVIERERPDIVVHELVGRRLFTHDPEDLRIER